MAGVRVAGVRQFAEAGGADLDEREFGEHEEAVERNQGDGDADVDE